MNPTGKFVKILISQSLSNLISQIVNSIVELYSHLVIYFYFKTAFSPKMAKNRTLNHHKITPANES